MERVGVKVNTYYASEIEKSSIIVTNSNYPKTIQLGDINNINLESLPKIDLILAGSPCQGFSRAGLGLNFEDPRSGLFFKFVEVLNWIRENNNKDVKFLLENVVMKKEWEKVITDYVGVNPIEINSNNFVPQNRPRIYWTDIHIDEIGQRDVKLTDILEEVDVSKFLDYKGLKIDPQISEKSKQLIGVVNGEVRIKQATKQGYIVAKDGDGVNLNFPTSKSRRGRVIKQKSSCLDCSCDICVYKNGIIRKLTVTELEKLQSLPIGYTNYTSEVARKKAIGNGWTVDVIAHILKGLKE